MKKSTGIFVFLDSGINHILEVPKFSKSGSTIIVPTEELLGVLISKNILDKFDSISNAIREVDYNNGFVQELDSNIDKVLDYSKKEYINNPLFYNHPYVKALFIFEERYRIINAYDSILSSYMIAISNMAKGMKPIEGEVVEESVFEMVRNLL